MSRHLVKEDGLFLGSSSACNLVACVMLAKKLSRGSRIVTILYVGRREKAHDKQNDMAYEGS